jgi:hypothetical protein
MKNLEKLSHLLAGLDDEFHAQVNATDQAEQPPPSVQRRSPGADPFQMDWEWATPSGSERRSATSVPVESTTAIGSAPLVRWAANWQRSWKTAYGVAVTAAALLFLVLWIGSSGSDVASVPREELTASVEVDAKEGAAAEKIYHVTCPRAGFVTIIPYRVGEGREQVAVEPRITDKLKRVKAEQAWKYVLPNGEGGFDSVVFVMTETPADSIVQRIVQQQLEAPGMPPPEEMRELIREELWKSGYTWVAFGMTQT